MDSDVSRLTEDDIHRVSKIAETISKNTQLSNRQAKSLILKEVVGMKNEDVVNHMDVSSPTTVGSHVSRVKNKFQSVEEEISELEQAIEAWEKTKQLERIIARFDTGSSEQVLNDLAQTVEDELVDDEDVVYLMRYFDENGEEQLRTVELHPRKIDEIENGFDVVQYRRLSSFDEVFE